MTTVDKVMTLLTVAALSSNETIAKKLMVKQVETAYRGVRQIFE
jgi:hypothetical protein